VAGGGGLWWYGTSGFGGGGGGGASDVVVAVVVAIAVEVRRCWATAYGRWVRVVAFDLFFCCFQKSVPRAILLSVHVCRG
jgi:hypothetical protein